MAAAAVGGLALGASQANADGYVRAPSYAAPFSWTGLYIGGQAGYMWSDYDFTVTGTNETTFNVNGAMGGGHVGYNWQVGSLVLGVEGDLNAVNATGDDGGFGGSLDRGKIKSSGSVRGRIGYAWDNWMWYATGGWAEADVTHTRVAIGESRSKMHDGWTIGTGVSVGLTKNIIAGVEYRFTDYQSKTYTWNASVPTITDPDTQEVTFRLSYKFGDDRRMAPLK
jgi:outer membrane immunogenic protein